MKILFVVLLIAAAAIAFGFRNRVSPAKKAIMVSATPKSFYELSYSDINGKNISMAEYKGKYVLIVNVASECGNTPQYSALQELYDKHKDKLVIIGFPCNQFGGQEPGSEKEIGAFCTKNYGVTFPLASKVDVKGGKQDKVFTWLTSKELNGFGGEEVEWNFHKFLVSPDGTWLASYKARMDPLNGELATQLK